MEAKRKSAIKDKAPQTRLLIAALDKVEVGEVATYEMLLQASGCNVQRDRGYIQTALKEMLRSGKNFRCVIGVGYRRLDDVDSLKLASDKVRESRRRSKRALSILDNVSIPDLPENKKAEFLATQAQAHFVNVATSPKGERRLIKAAAGQSVSVLPFYESLKALTGQKEDEKKK